MQNIESPPAVQQLQHTATFIREGFVILTPAQANVILRECLYDRQRRVDKDHVSVLAEQMRRDLWERKDKIDFARIAGRLVLINGYHRMNAQIASARNVEWTVVIHECATEADVRRLYHKFDTNVRKRSDENILNGVDFGPSVGLSPVWSKSLFGSVPIIANGLNTGNRGAGALFARRIMDDRLTMARDFSPAAIKLAELFRPAPEDVRKKVRIKTIFAVALVTVQHQPEIAAEFWGGLARNDGLRRGDPRQTLLHDMGTRNFHLGILQQGIVSPALAWNAFWERRELKIIKVIAGRKFRLCGTPYTVTA